MRIKPLDEFSDGSRFNQVSLIISMIAVMAYSLLFLGLYHYLMNGIVSGIALAPALIIGWLYGKRIGLVGGILLSAWNMLLFELMGASALKLTLLGPGLMGSLFLICIGSVAGWVSDLHWQTRQQTKQLRLEITERERVEQELRTSEAYNRAVVSAFPDMIFVLDREGTFLTYQAPAATALYAPSNSITNSNIKDTMPDEFAQLCLRYITQAIETGTLQVFEYQLPIYEGLEDYEARLVKINDDSVLAVVRNMTILKQVQQQQITLAVQQKHIETLNELINNFSHDFKTPLSVINTSVYILQRQLETKTAEKQLEKIQRQSTRLEKYIEAVLTLSQLDNDPNLHFAELNLEQVLNALETKFQTLGQQNIHLTFHMSDNNPSISGDYRILSQALEHLIDNAISYNHAGGEITVRSYVMNQQVVIEIKDTGVGIDSAYHTRIFERFYRVDPARNSDTGGIGLGLAIVRKIVELHGGEIELESQLNNGSIFRIYLPMAETVVPYIGFGDNFSNSQTVFTD